MPPRVIVFTVAPSAFITTTAVTRDKGMANAVISSPDPERAASTAEGAARWLSRRLSGSAEEVELESGDVLAATAVVVAAALAVLLAISVIDWEHKIIPDRLSKPGTALFVALAPATQAQGVIQVVVKSRAVELELLGELVLIQAASLAKELDTAVAVEIEKLRGAATFQVGELEVLEITVRGN